MYRKFFRLLSSLGLSTFLLFMLTITSVPVFAHSIATKAPSTPTSPLDTINTNVICSPDLLSSGWTQTGNGPSSFGCGGHAWQVSTPTSAFAQWGLGVVDVNVNATYTLRAFITQPADAIVDYVIYIGHYPTTTTCTISQYSVPVGWNTVCSFKVTSNNAGDSVTIEEQSGQRSPRTMSVSAIQLLRH